MARVTKVCVFESDLVCKSNYIYYKQELKYELFGSSEEKSLCIQGCF